MYLRADHADADTATLRRLVRENPLGILTTALPSDHFPLMQCSHIPFLLDVEDETSETEQGILRGHMARANPHTKALIEAAQAAAAGSSDGYLKQEVMVLFNFPVQHYVTPKFYTETKPDTGKVVPTWNYAAAQVYGKIRVYHDTKSDAAGRFLGQQISDLSDMSERSIMGYTGEGSTPRGWRVTDAPEKYIALLTKAIVGIEIRVDKLQGKFKMSQEMGEGDRAGVVAGFRGLGTEMGARMSETVAERAELKKSRKAAAQLAN